MRTLTTAAIERLQPPAQGQVDYFDKGYPGLALRCSYRGAKTFVHVYRLRGKLRRATLGRFPAMSLAEAREAWRRAREAIEKGDDPTRQREIKADTFATVAADWLNRDQAGNRTVAEVARIMSREATSVWGDRLIAKIGRRDVIELIDAVADRGSPVAARRLHAHLHRLFRWSVGRGILDANPMADLPKRPDAKPRDRVLSDAEIAVVWKASASLGEGDSGDITPGWPFGPVVRLLLLTAARRDETNGLCWSEIADDEIRLAGDRTKNGEPHRIPLSAPAAALIDALPHITDSDFVFTTTGKRLVESQARARRRGSDDQWDGTTALAPARSASHSRDWSPASGRSTAGHRGDPRPPLRVPCRRRRHLPTA